ncbi:uncharacterized protein LOC121863038 isoform X1 [Homarus americanus]|uniref:uncharacterized protein LOC121863038 isoform X1 n=1 Tax=Homarus americanus TaxID=6706 RepID=UPI001C44DF81|nr:uncharacterized protein LOC121863038 isoform X1 [Homarus americanus]XP_042217432.1 uncharacterized protein LOC121863038 isoform X1 [Homarus americanus]XP_042217434.1 uncharacterized protein LOC121863038 isoform X1 [Homarus americanus]XP_042217435.1 uncharacterized protein LOC121863038 isoform X1 [Homarus americanus]
MVSEKKTSQISQEKSSQEKTSQMVSQGKTLQKVSQGKTLHCYLEVRSALLMNDDPEVVSKFVDNFTPVRMMESGEDLKLENILTREVMYEEGKLIPPRDRVCPEVLIITGAPGIGKTCLCRYIMAQWSNGSERIEELLKTDLLMLLDMKSINSGTLTDYLHGHLLKNTCRNVDPNYLLPVLCEINTGFIIDSMDEATHHGRKLIEEVFSHHIKSNRNRIIISARPECTENVIELTKSYKLDYILVTLEGFTKDNFGLYAKKTIDGLFDSRTDSDLQYKEFMKFIHENSDALQENIKNPLSASLLIIFWKERANIIDVSRTISRLSGNTISYETCKKKVVRIKNR